MVGTEGSVIADAFESAPYPLAVIGADGRILQANRIFRDWFGDSCVGRAAEQMVGGASAGLASMLESLCSEGHAFYVNDMLLRVDARELRVEARGQPLREAGGRLLSLVDVTERVSAATALAQRERSESMARLAEGLAHDLNNMLAAIVATAQAGRADAEDGVGDSGADFSAIIDEAERGASLARSLNAMAFDDTGSWRPVNLAAELRVVAALLGRGSAAVPIMLEIDDAAAEVVGDRARLHQLVLNLLVNARDAVRPVGGGIEVSLEPTASGGVRLVVADSGPGIPGEIRDRILEPYFTTKGKRRGGGQSWGMGLGLTIVDAVARSTDATLTIGDRPGGGAMFSVEWPRTAVTRPDFPLTARTKRTVAPALVLLADDEAALAGAVARQLRRSGHSVYVAISAAECRRLFEECKASIDVAVIDVLLGDGNGRRLAEQFRDARPDLGIVLISATAGSSISGSSAPDRILLKPFDVAELADAIEEARRAGRSRAQLSNA